MPKPSEKTSNKANHCNLLPTATPAHYVSVLNQPAPSQPVTSRPPRTISVFRAGPCVVGAHTGEVASLYNQADSFRPAHHSPRSASIYASPTLTGVARWARAMLSLYGEPYELTELFIDPTNVFLYSVPHWETASISGWATKSGLDFTEYWNTAIPLSDWSTRSAQHQLDATEWEVLVPTTAIIRTRPVSPGRLLAAAEGLNAQELPHLIKQARRRAS